MSRFNAYLKYTPIGKSALTYNMWVTDYTQPHTLSGSSSQSKMYKHFYPKNYAPGNITVNGRVPGQDDYNNLAAFIRSHHEEMMRNPGLSNTPGSTSPLPLLTFYIDNEGILVEGFIASFQAGAQRWNPAPPFTFDFFVVNDAHSTNANIVPAYALRTMWTGQFVDEGDFDPDNIVEPVVSTSVNGNTTTITTVIGP